MNLLRDFELTTTHISFRLGECEDFQHVLARLKSIPLAERQYDPEDYHRWTIKRTPENEAVLAETFDNFGQCMTIALSQLSLF